MIHCTKVAFAFDDHVIFSDANISIQKGEFVYIVGETGCGKTTLMRLLYMDILPTNGIVQVDSFSSASIKKRELYQLRRRLGIIFQDFRLLDDRSVYNNVTFALQAVGYSSREIKMRTTQALSQVGLIHKKNSPTGELSGGEQQRLSIARAIAKDPVAILADEPTGNLDPATSADILTLLKKINLGGTTVLVATHNYELIRKFPARTIAIRNCKCEELDPLSLQSFPLDIPGTLED
ncbi:MAG TPA: ATP-binding cassette domain-containing protein [Candidatus Kryptonia bacterium]